MIAEFHNHQTRWVHFYERLLLEHGFEILQRRTTRTDRPVFFCRRGKIASDELMIDNGIFKRVRSWRKGHRRFYLLDQNGNRFLCKRYAEEDILHNRHPRQEFALLRAFADCPNVVQPVCCDDRRIVFPYIEARPVEVIDEQPLQAANLASPVLRLRIVEAMSHVMASYYARQGKLFQQFASNIPDRYREEVRTGRRLLVDLCPSNILVTHDGHVCFVDFEPSKPPLSDRIIREMRELCHTTSPRGWRRWFSH